jgi:hypothetical protein
LLEPLGLMHNFKERQVEEIDIELWNAVTVLFTSDTVVGLFIKVEPVTNFLAPMIKRK